jgi:hypothetical protein
MASPEKFLPETMGGGGLFFDFDGDGWLDILLINGGPIRPESESERTADHRLYRNREGTFEDVSEDSGIVRSGHGMGACAADVDDDGDLDVYVTSFGDDRLYENDGKGRFEDVTASAGIDVGLWSASCAFGDVDNDGDVDLYVTRYVDFSVGNNRVCTAGRGLRVYCHPNVYNGVPDVLYLNDGDGTFIDRSAEAGISRHAGKGLGVVFGDYDDDGWADLYVANDSVPNFMFRNKGDGTFEEVALFLRVAVGANGQPLAGMGTDMGDLDGDGLDDVFVTNLDRQMHTVYGNLGRGLFTDMTLSSGAGALTSPYVGFGTAFVDFDNDGDLDIAIANGHVIDNVAEAVRANDTYPQTNLLLENDGDGRFGDATPTSGPGWGLEKVGRALAAGDIDNDGDIDFLVVNNGQDADLLVNDGRGKGTALVVRLIGTTSNRDGIGARLTLALGERELIRRVRAGSSWATK